MLYKNISLCIGKTPLIELNNIKKEFNLKCNIYAKVEYFNPTGSVKDRIALSMINDAEEKGLIKEGAVIIEPTSGNTGIGIASICAIRGYRCILVMPESMSIERRKILSAYGAELVLTEASKGMGGAIEKAKELNKEIENSIILGQFDNDANVRIHYQTTGPEIVNDLGDLDYFVAGVGTGGTLTGSGKYIKENIKHAKVVAVEPESSPMISKGEKGPHAIQGIGAGFIPKILDKDLIDEVITVNNDDAFEYAKLVGKKEGFLVGISAGAALCAAIKIALRNENKNIVVIFPDSGDRYLSTKLF